uniref:Uncharacterized protein n=1 Tax=Sus scrofa TaxID=9823 RepID=A0A8D1LAY0_PIG
LRPLSIILFTLSLLIVASTTATFGCWEQAQTIDWRATLQTNQSSSQNIDTYLNSILDVLAGQDWLC